MTPAYVRQPMTGHGQFITPLTSDRRPPVGRDTRPRREVGA